MTVKKSIRTRRRWTTPVILATQKAKIRRIAVRSQPWANSFSRPYVEKIHHKKGLGGMAQGVGPEFKLQYRKKKRTGGMIQVIKSLIAYVRPWVQSPVQPKKKKKSNQDPNFLCIKFYWNTATPVHYNGS
jgi:hypothetical protein